jgi:hypothetical protein
VRAEVEYNGVSLVSCWRYPERDMKYSRWKMAIERSFGWAAEEADTEMYEEGTNFKLRNVQSVLKES